MKLNEGTIWASVFIIFFLAIFYFAFVHSFIIYSNMEERKVEVTYKVYTPKETLSYTKTVPIRFTDSLETYQTSYKGSNTLYIKDKNISHDECVLNQKVIIYEGTCHSEVTNIKY